MSSLVNFIAIKFNGREIFINKAHICNVFESNGKAAITVLANNEKGSVVNYTDSTVPEVLEAWQDNLTPNLN